jgi:poly(ADP-ribose) glycohydrolase
MCEHSFFFVLSIRDSWDRKLCHVVAMDAIYHENPLTKYTVHNMSHELIKAYTCFRIPTSVQHFRFGIATGNWECGAFNGDREVKGRNIRKVSSR